MYAPPVARAATGSTTEASLRLARVPSPDQAAEHTSLDTQRPQPFPRAPGQSFSGMNETGGAPGAGPFAALAALKKP